MNFFKLLLLVLLGGGLIFLLLYILIITFLRKRDLKIDYSNKQIRFFIQNINGIDYLIIPYLFWQNGKLNAIRDLFSDHFEYNGICYKIELLYTNQSHLQQVGDLLPHNFYRDCKSVIKRIDSQSTNYGNINNTYINGNNNQLSIQQSQYLDIGTEIEKFIQKNENLLSASDKDTLESFLYQLSKGSPQKSNAQKAIDVLSKFLPFSTAIINMIKALAF